MINETINLGYFVLMAEFISMFFAGMLKNNKVVFLLLVFMAATVLIYFA